MSSDHLRDIINYRIERAYESYEEARILSGSNHWNACLSRLYYACFYAVNALLVKNDKSSSKHTGVRSIFNKDFVQNGIVPKARNCCYL